MQTIIEGKPVTLEQFIIDREKAVENATGEFSRLFRDLALAIKNINREVNRAGLVDIASGVGRKNANGEEIKQLDDFANDYLIHSLKAGRVAAIVASEEEEEIVVVNDEAGKYVVLLDPLDGSSNMDVGVPVGTIFSIYQRLSPYGKAGIDDCLQMGVAQVAAGYVLYGSSAILVYTTGRGVNGFTLDPTIGEFFLSHPSIRMPESGGYISHNYANAPRYDKELKAYLESINARNAAQSAALSYRYVGSLVADFHRNLLKGGIFLYPGLLNKPKGKLRLLYEANPMAFIAEQAGGLASNGRERILQVKPEELHECTPLFIGSEKEILNLLAFTHKEQPVSAD